MGEAIPFGDHGGRGAGSHGLHEHELVVRELCLSYQQIPAFREVEFRTRCGQCLGLLGPNGAGKSSLLKAIAGLVPPEGGEIIWRGQAMRKSIHEIAYLPQREEVDWNFPVTVRGVVEMGRYPQVSWWRRFRQRDEEVVDRALEAMALQDLAKRQVSELSGGQQQRVFLARALAQESHVLLLDEPFTGLDRPAQESLSRLLRQLASEGRLVIASHHDLGTVEKIFDEVLLLRCQQVAFGPTESTFHEENLNRTYGSVLSALATR
ncbi:MAG: metal ABC transporter ATP-binding protein [Verrucomicrobiota bacterium]